MSHYVCFGPFRFEPLTVRLWQDKGEVRITRKAGSVLGVLLDRAGQLVTKQDLFDSVWKDSLVSCIQELRKALRDDAKQPRFIETRHRIGYLFAAAVNRVSKENAEPLTASERPAAIAVLPFADMSPGRDQDYFCEGLAEELIDALTQVDGLRVSARSSSFQFGTNVVDLREAGRRLGVTALLQGSVRKADDRLRITVQLIDVDSGYQRWSQRFESNVGDVFAVQDEIAGAVASALRGDSLSPQEQRAVRRPHTTTAPYEYFLRGRQRVHRMQQPDMDESRLMFEKAIALDADYAPAWAGLATVHALLFEWWGGRDEDLQLADRASQKALALAPDLAEAHVSRGCALTLGRRYEEAQSHFEAAIRINPHLFDGYYYYGRAAFSQGQIELSADLFRKASEVRREDFQSAVLLAQSLRMLGRTEEGRSANQEGILRAERILELNPLDCRVLALGSCALHEAGESERAMEWSRRSLQLYPDDMSALLNAVCLRARLGLKEEALAILERVCSRGWGKRDWIDQDPEYDLLRDDPRFKALMAKLK
jgi:TolB-like protein/Tfp pilus assembly protein PilF